MRAEMGDMPRSIRAIVDKEQPILSANSFCVNPRRLRLLYIISASDGLLDIILSVSNSICSASIFES